MTTMIGISVEEIPSRSLPSATGIFHFVRAMVGGIGTSVFTTFWQRRTYFHHERLGSVLTPYNPMTPKITSEETLQMLNDAVDQQAALLSINDAFYMMAWMFVGLILLLISWNFLKKKKAAAPVVIHPSGE
jgi:DHA2 family multidrug resistance protein